MTWGRTSAGGGRRRPLWSAVVHGSVLLGTLGGLTAFWATLALTAAVLVTPVETMGTFERRGAWAIGDALRNGSHVLLAVIIGEAR